MNKNSFTTYIHLVMYSQIINNYREYNNREKWEIKTEMSSDL